MKWNKLPKFSINFGASKLPESKQEVRTFCPALIVAMRSLGRESAPYLDINLWQKSGVWLIDLLTADGSGWRSGWTSLPENKRFFQAFTVVFLLEMMLRLFALGPRAYFSSKWNMYDGAVIVAGFLGYFYQSAAGISIFRILRLVRYSFTSTLFEAVQENYRSKCFEPR